MTDDGRNVHVEFYDAPDDSSSSRFFRSEARGAVWLKQAWTTLLSGHRLDFCDPYKQPNENDKTEQETLPLTPVGNNDPLLSEREIIVAVYESPSRRNRKWTDTPEQWRSTPGSSTVSPLTTPRELRRPAESSSNTTPLASSRRRLFAASTSCRSWKRRLGGIIFLFVVVVACLLVEFCERSPSTDCRRWIEISKERLQTSRAWTRDQLFDRIRRHETLWKEVAILYDDFSQSISKSWNDTLQPSKRASIPSSSSSIGSSAAPAQVTLLSLQSPRMQNPRAFRIVSAKIKKQGHVIAGSSQQGSFLTRIGSFLGLQFRQRLHWIVPLAAGSLFPSMQWVVIMALLSRLALIGTDVSKVEEA